MAKHRVPEPQSPIETIQSVLVASRRECSYRVVQVEEEEEVTAVVVNDVS